jgi:hypothetical protein
MKPFNGRWLKRTLAIAGSAAIILVGIVLLMVSLQHHFGSDFFDTSHTNIYFVLLFVGIILAGVFLLLRLNKEPDCSEVNFPDMRVNVLCLMGALLGFFCMVELHWASGSYTVPYPGRLIYIMADWSLHPPIESFETGEVYSWLFVVGTVLAFFSPLAGYLQLSGIMVFSLDLFDTVNGPAGTGHWNAAGLVVAIVAASMVLASLAFPYGVGYKGKPIDLPGRVLTVSSPAFAEKITRWRHHKSRYLRSTDSHQ